MSLLLILILVLLVLGGGGYGVRAGWYGPGYYGGGVVFILAVILILWFVLGCHRVPY